VASDGRQTGTCAACGAALRGGTWVNPASMVCRRWRRTGRRCGGAARGSGNAASPDRSRSARRGCPRWGSPGCARSDTACLSVVDKRSYPFGGAPPPPVPHQPAHDSMHNDDYARNVRIGAAGAHANGHGRQIQRHCDVCPWTGPCCPRTATGTAQAELSGKHLTARDHRAHVQHDREMFNFDREPESEFRGDIRRSPECR